LDPHGRPALCDLGHHQQWHPTDGRRGPHQKYGLNALKEQRKTTTLTLLLSQFRSPLVLILIFAAVVSAVLGEWTDAGIVLAVVIGSTMLGFAQEYRASNSVENCVRK
jgi:P-type Mg2+ transporter